MSEIDTLLDATLDELEDLPEFKPFPAGAHRIKISLEQKEVNSKPAIEAKMEYLECMELTNPADTAPAAGDSTNSLFFLDNEFGRGKLKAVLASLADTIGSRNNREIIEGTKDVECIILSTQDKDKKYTNIVELNVI